MPLKVEDASLKELGKEIPRAFSGWFKRRDAILVMGIQPVT